MGVLADTVATAQKIGEGRRIVLGTPAYLAREGRPETPSDLPKHSAIVYAQRGGGEEWTFSQDRSEVRATLSGRIRTTAAEALREAVLAGLGLCIATDWMFEAELRSGIVETVLDDWQLPVIDLWAVFPSGRRVTAKARAFVRFVEATLRERPS